MEFRPKLLKFFFAFFRPVYHVKKYCDLEEKIWALGIIADSIFTRKTFNSELTLSLQICSNFMISGAKRTKLKIWPAKSWKVPEFFKFSKLELPNILS